jgi:hypothetical protein
VTANSVLYLTTSVPAMTSPSMRSLHAGSTATCAGAPDCDIIGGTLGVSPGTSVTGNFDFDIDLNAVSAGCARDGLATWKAGRATTGGVAMLAEMGGA